MKLIVFITSFLLILSVTPYNINAFYYLAIVISFIITITHPSNITDKVLPYFLLSIFLSIIVNDIPEQFTPFTRFIVYLFIVIGFGPIFINQYLFKLRLKFLQYSLFCCSSIVIISFILMIIGVIPRINPKETAGGFAGITVQSMTMAPIAFLSFIFCWYKIINNNKRILVYLYTTILLISLLTLILTGSRSALVSCCISSFIFLYITLKGKISKIIKYSFLFIIMLIISFPIWQNYTTAITNKMVTQKTMEGKNSRSYKWENRLKEIAQHPILGTGFFSIDMDISKYDINDNNTIEYGSSWLAIFSTTGILGFILFSYLYIKNTVKLIRLSTESKMKPLIISISIFLGLEMIFEGFILGIGNILNIYFWLILSILASSIKYHNINIPNKYIL